MTVYVSINDPVVSENASFVDFVLTLSAASATTVSVPYSTQSVSASNGGDYSAQSGTLVFAPGILSQTVRIALLSDTSAEPLEMFKLSLGTAVNAVLTRTEGTAIIVDNDTLASSSQPASLSVRDLTTDEAAGTATFTVLLDKATSDSFSVAYSTLNGSASGGADYSAASGTLSFSAGETSKTVTIALANDSSAELEESFYLNLGTLSGNAAGAVRLADASGQASIVRNDQTALAAPIISVANASVTENAGYVDVVVSLSAPGANQVSVNYATASMNASNSSDYNAVSGTLVFAPGVTSQMVRVSLNSDTTVEGLELFAFNLSNPVNAIVSDSNGMISLVDNDVLADSLNQASLIVRDVSIDEGAGTATFTVTLDKAAADSFSVAWSTSGGSATQDSDFVGAAGSLTFGAGETVKTITIEIGNDSLAELEETFQLNLGALSGNAAAAVQVAAGNGQAVIARGDQTPVGSPVISASNPVAGEGDGYIDFVVSLSAPGIAQVSVNYSTASTTATNSSDYLALNGTLVFASGVTSQTVRIPLLNNTSVEGIESFSLQLSNPVNAVVGKPFGNATIVDNDTLADTQNVASLSVRDVMVDEGAGTATFTVLLDKAASNSFSVAYTTANGSARDGSDFTGVRGSLSFAPGETARTITVNLGSDTLAEQDEFFFLKLGVVTGKAADMVQVADGMGQATIGRNDLTSVGTPVVSIASVVGGESSGYVDLLVTLSAPSLSQVSVNYSTSSETASSSSDYEAGNGTLLFAPGVTTQSVRVQLIDSTAAENPELFFVSLSSAVNATIGKSGASVTVIDNDTLGDTVTPSTLSVGDVVVNESTGTATFDVVLSRANSAAFSVSYGTVNGSAVAGGDYTAALGSLTFAPGETVKSVTVSLVADGAAEQDELFGLQLGTVSGKGAASVLVSDALGQAIIARNGLAQAATPLISASAVTVGESDAYAEFVVRLSAPSASTVTVNYATASATAGSSSDYNAVSGSLRFAPGDTAHTVRVPIINSTGAEVDETFSLNLSSATNATIGTASVSALLIDNDTLADSLAPASLSMQPVSVNEHAGSATFALVLSRAATAAFSVAYNTVDGSASAGSDYFSASGVVGFAPGETVKLVTVALVADPYAEASETFELHLGAPSGAGSATVVLASMKAVATIGNINSASAALSMSSSTASITEGNSVTFTLSNTGLAAGTQLPFTMSGVSAASVAQPLQGAFTVNTGGNASVSFDFIDNLSVDLARMATVSVPGASASVALTDPLARSGTAANDALSGTSANDKIDGGAGVDTLTLSGPSTNYDITFTTGGYFLNDATGASGRDLLVNVERLVFSDKTVALDINGTAGQVYRIYQAAFDRQPDQGGVGFWMSQMDRGLSLETVAEGFVQSAEFASVFGVDPSTEAFVSKVYSNVLHRAPDAGGYAFWVNAVNNGVSRAVMLAAVSESAENQAQVIGTIQNGFDYLPYP